MSVRYDHEADALSVQLDAKPRGRVTTREVAPGIYLDFDTRGLLVALEVLQASRRVPARALAEMAPPIRLITLAEAAEESGLSPVTLRAQIQAGRLKAEKRGRDWMLDDVDLINYLESRALSGRPAATAKGRAKSARRVAARKLA